MKKLMLGLTAVFALSVVTPAFAGEEGKDEKPAKAEKKGGKKGGKKGEEKKAE
jgi:hypothetical protein